MLDCTEIYNPLVSENLLDQKKNDTSYFGKEGELIFNLRGLQPLKSVKLAENLDIRAQILKAPQSYRAKKITFSSSMM